MSSNTTKLYKYKDGLLFELKEEDIAEEYKRVIFVCQEHGTRLIPENVLTAKGSLLYFSCPFCANAGINDGFRFSEDYNTLRKKALSMVNKIDMKNATLIKIDDFYIPEIKHSVDLGDKSDYFVKSEVKTDKDGDTIVVLYIGRKSEGKKAQLFVKPEKLQLSHDYKDMDPSKILSKIELVLKDRTITQRYDG